MENKPLNNPTLSHKRPCKDKQYKPETQIVYEYLQTHTVTSSMVVKATGIPQKHITRYKRKLEKSGRLWVVERKACKVTGYKAQYLTTNPELSQVDKQLKLF